MDWWFEKYEYKFKEKYYVKNFGKLGRDIKKLLSVYSLEDLQYKAIEFFLDGSEFIVGNEEKEIDAAGHTIEVFQARINKYQKYKDEGFQKR